jgi:hypothetical protein
VQNEAWMCGTEGIVERMVELINEERFPVDWRESVNCPIYKKGEKNRAKTTVE